MHSECSVRFSHRFSLPVAILIWFYMLTDEFRVMVKLSTLSITCRIRAFWRDRFGAGVLAQAVLTHGRYGATKLAQIYTDKYTLLIHCAFSRRVHVRTCR